MIEHAVLWYHAKLKKTLEEHLCLELRESMALDYSIPKEQVEEDQVCKMLGAETEW